MFPSIVCHSIRWSRISVEPAHLQCTPNCFCGNGRKPTSGLIVRLLIYNVQCGVIVDVENIYIHRVAKFDIVFQTKLKPSGTLSIHLTGGTMFFSIRKYFTSWCWCEMKSSAWKKVCKFICSRCLKRRCSRWSSSFVKWHCPAGLQVRNGCPF